MIWLHRPPFVRWVLAIAVLAGSVWIEFGAGATVEHPFASSVIADGDAITMSNTELRSVPAGLLPRVEASGFASRAFDVGEPITPSGLTEDRPTGSQGWWALEMNIPMGAVVGDRAHLVLLDSGLVVEGVVESVATDDPFASADGTVAVPPEHSGAVAAGVASGRVVVLIATG